MRPPATWNGPPRVNLALAAMTPCLVPPQLGVDSASAMRQGTVPAVGATAVGGQDARFSISLKGLPSALDRIAEFTK